MNARYLYKGKIKGNLAGHKELDWAIGNLIVEQSTGKHFIIDLSHFDESTRLCDVVIEVEPSTICQCNGLTDKNGQKIWENDIVHNGNYFVVKWNHSCARFDIALNNSHNIPVGRWEPMIIDWRTNDFKEYRNDVDFEIIGNIFNNPELLEVEHDRS